MTTPVSGAVRPAAPRGAQPLAMAVVAKAGGQDRPVTPEASARAWVRQLQGSLYQDGVATCRQHVARGQQLLAAGGLTPDTEARVHLMLSGAHGRLAELKDSQMSNGRSAYFEAAKAFDAGSHLPDVAVAYGRTIAAFTALNWGERRVVEAGVGISIKNQARRAATALAAFPRDAWSQVARQRLAAYVGDKAMIAAADRAVAALDAGAVARASAEIARDVDYKKKKE